MLVCCLSPIKNFLFTSHYFYTSNNFLVLLGISWYSQLSFRKGVFVCVKSQLGTCLLNKCSSLFSLEGLFFSFPFCWYSYIKIGWEEWFIFSCCSSLIYFMKGRLLLFNRVVQGSAFDWWQALFSPPFIFLGYKISFLKFCFIPGTFEHFGSLILSFLPVFGIFKDLKVFNPLFSIQTQEVPNILIGFVWFPGILMA